MPMTVESFMNKHSPSASEVPAMEQPPVVPPPAPKKPPETTVAPLGLINSTIGESQATSPAYALLPEIEQCFRNMLATKSNAEIVQALSSVRGGSEQATQVLLTAIKAIELIDERNAILSLIFRLPLAKDGGYDMK